jgi:hypothetical protein
VCIDDKVLIDFFTSLHDDLLFKTESERERSRENENLLLVKALPRAYDNLRESVTQFYYLDSQFSTCKMKSERMKFMNEIEERQSTGVHSKFFTLFLTAFN